MTEVTDALRTAQTERHALGEKPLGNAHCIPKYFSPKNYAEVEIASVKHGAVRGGCGVQNKGEPLLDAADALKKQTDDVQPPFAKDQ